MGLIEGILAGLCLVTAVVLVVHLVRNTVPGALADNLVALLELGLLVHLVVGIVHLVRDGHDVSAFTYVGYLLAGPLLLPAAWIWSRGDRSRGGTAVLLGAMVVIPFLFVRVHQVWGGA